MSALLGNATVSLRGVCMQLTNGLDIEILVSIPGGGVKIWTPFWAPYLVRDTLSVAPFVGVLYVLPLNPIWIGLLSVYITPLMCTRLICLLRSVPHLVSFLDTQGSGSQDPGLRSHDPRIGCHGMTPFWTSLFNVLYFMCIHSLSV